MDTSLIQTPLYYGLFPLCPEKILTNLKKKNLLLSLYKLTQFFFVFAGLICHFQSQNVCYSYGINKQKKKSSQSLAKKLALSVRFFRQTLGTRLMNDPRVLIFV